MSKYQRDEVIARLIKNGLKPVYSKKTNKLMYFKKPKKRTIGIKLLGYLDFLKVKAI